MHGCSGSGFPIEVTGGQLGPCVPVPHSLWVTNQLDVVHRDRESIRQVAQEVLIDPAAGPLPRCRDQQDGRWGHRRGRLNEGLDTHPRPDKLFEMISDQSHLGALLSPPAGLRRSPTSPPAHLTPPPIISCLGYVSWVRSVGSLNRSTPLVCTSTTKRGTDVPRSPIMSPLPPLLLPLTGLPRDAWHCAH